MVYRRTKNDEHLASRRQEASRNSPAVDASPQAAVLAQRERTAGIIYIVTALLQILIGIFLLPTAWIIGMLNLFGCTANFRRAKEVCDPYPGMVSEYHGQLKTLIFSFIGNLFLGGIVGVAPVIYDLLTRKYVLENKDLFLQAEAEY